MAVKKRGLGRGLDALLGTSGATATASPGEELQEIPVASVKPGPHQPRRRFDPEAMQSLAESIKSQGVVQPIVVRPDGANGFEIVAGERRWRAAKDVGLKTIPAVVRELPDRAAMAVALVENIQRADLNAMEEAEALQRMIKEVKLTHEQCASAVGRSRAAVSNLLRLFELNDEVQELVRTEKLSLGHAKVLLGVSGAAQSTIAAKVVAEQCSVRQAEEMVRAAAGGGAKPRPRGGAGRTKSSPLEADLTARLGMPVRVRAGAGGGGQLTVRYRNKAELDRLTKRLR